MSSYWLICLPRQDIEHCIRIGVFGLARPILISKVQIGDKIVCCAGKGDWKIIALGETITDYYNDDSEIFLKSGNFIDRFGFIAKKNGAEIDIPSIVDQFSFVSNTAYWAVFFRSGIAKLSLADWELCQRLALAD